MSREQPQTTSAAAFKTASGRKKLLIDAATSVLQLAVSSATLFILYRYLLQVLGAETLGLWSLLLAVSSTVQIANMGLGGSLTKAVAEADPAQDHAIPLQVQTTVISIGGIAALAALCVYPAAQFYLEFILKGESKAEVIALLPMVLLGFWLAMVSSVYQATLYGLQLIRHRNAVLAGESICHLALCVALAPRYGLAGIIAARVIQNVLTLASLVILLRIHVKSLPWVPRRWSRSVFNQLAGYAAEVQVITLLAMFADPFTKGLLGRYGSVAMVGYYEMANRLVQQFRAVVLSINQISLPMFAKANVADRPQVGELFMTAYRLNYFLCVPGFCLLVVCTPLISQAWIGRYESAFVGAVMLLSVGWLLNTIALPAYFASLGTGKLGLNLASHVLMSVMNVVLGFVLGSWLGGTGVILSWAAALGAAGALLISMYFRQSNRSASDLIPHSHRSLTLLCAVVFALAFLLELQLRHDLATMAVPGADAMVVGSFAISIALALLIICVAWSNETRRQIAGWAVAAFRVG
jgi:O-antigen/teichoic acid export membrane protein